MVITEMQLPDVTGYAVLKALRGNAATADLSCIVLSGDAMPGHIKRALAAGFDDHWTKPIDIRTLLQKIDEAAAKGRLGFHQRMEAASAMDCRHPACRLGLGSSATSQDSLLPALVPSLTS